MYESYSLSHLYRLASDVTLANFEHFRRKFDPNNLISFFRKTDKEFP